MTKNKDFYGAVADIKSAIATLDDVKDAGSIVELLRLSLAATRMLLHKEWSQRTTWVSYPNGFLATVVEMPDESGVSYAWYIRPTGVINEQYGLCPSFACASCGPDMAYVRRGTSNTLQSAKETVSTVAEELLQLRHKSGAGE
jgi:hypothetical protein